MTAMSHSLVLGAYDLRNSSGGLTILAAIRRASSLVNSLAADLQRHRLIGSIVDRD